MQASTDNQRALWVGLVVTIIVTAIMLPLVFGGILGIDKPFAVAFVKSIFGAGTPLPVGIVLHLGYVTVWGAVFVAYLRDRPFVNAFFTCRKSMGVTSSVLLPRTRMGCTRLVGIPFDCLNTTHSPRTFSSCAWGDWTYHE